MTPEQFLTRLRISVSGKRTIALSVRDEQAWPHFEITGQPADTPSVKGYYCESGDSFIQVGSSGREEFTGSEEAAEKFVELIGQILDVLSRHGCLEKRWTTSRGEVKRSVIDLALKQGRTTYRLGKAPHFWQVGLTLSTKHFLPFESRLEAQ